MPWRSTGSEPAMLILSFLIALALAVYLVVTLLAAERF
jgi:K+-transporting ATPase KdpF subunit